ncbi:MAG TPA: sugar phosphate nucleotidyltransferase [Candidatus Saccharimonadales bacterium]|nr:sugar phosphate nucleotidyltransferase [Candidatus Saccharimonadales bacterium]
MSTPPTITTAIIPASGFNTRRLPVTAAFPKDFMPIGNRPAIDYLVDDLVRAGITDIYMVVHPFQHDLFERYFHGYEELDHHLQRKHKQVALDELHTLRARASFHFIDNTVTVAGGMHGSTVSLRLALEQLSGLDGFIYASADDFTVRSDGGSDMVDLVQAFQSTGADGAVLGMTAPLADLKQMGVFEVRPEAGTPWLKQVVEKPAHPEKLPQPRSANIGKYLFTATIRPFVDQTPPNPANNEYMITDVLNSYVKEHRLVVVPAEGSYYDVGTVKNWLAANQALVDSRG